MNIRKYLIDQNWNIGFIENFTPADLIREKKLPKIEWMNHSYKDRAFADPHILTCDEDVIIVLCEELVFGKKGIISQLTISRDDFKLIDKKEILKLPTHLSYPAIVERDGEIYIYPENSESGSINYYHYNKANCHLTKIGIIADGELTDLTIYPKPINNKFFALSTKLYPDSEQNVYLFQSDALLGPYTQVYNSPVVSARSCSRPGGNFFEVGNYIFRPAQDCDGRYGKGLKIMRIHSFKPFKESELFELKPHSYKYNLGLHTLNFTGNLAVIDGYGYLYPTIGRFLCPINKLRHKLK